MLHSFKSFTKTIRDDYITYNSIIIINGSINLVGNVYICLRGELLIKGDLANAFNYPAHCMAAATTAR